MTKFSSEHGLVVGEEDVKEWFDDVTEALYQTVWLTVVCGDRQLAAVQAAQYDLDRAVARLVVDQRPSYPKRLRYQLAKTYQAVHVAARADLGGVIPELARADFLENLKRDADEEASNEA